MELKKKNGEVKENHIHIVITRKEVMKRSNERDGIVVSGLAYIIFGS